MPGGGEYYADWWWEDLPEEAVKAANAMGYTQSTWDDDESIPYDNKAFHECTVTEKCAAMFLGMDPIASKLDDIWWEDATDEIKKYAIVLGWNESNWDEDYNLIDLPCNEWSWADMTSEQRTAAQYFGYTRVTWDETGEVLFEAPTSSGTASSSTPSKPTGKVSGGGGSCGSGNKPGKEDEKKEGTEQTSSSSSTSNNTTTTGTSASNKEDGFSISSYYGGVNGTPFDHRNHRYIESIELWESRIIYGLKVTYTNHIVESAGDEHGKHHTISLDMNEYINKIDIRHDRVVQELTFYTNTGKKFGPYGGEGRLLSKDKKGEVTTVTAPANSALCGFIGRDSKLIDALAFRWGPAAHVSSRPSTSK